MKQPVFTSSKPNSSVHGLIIYLSQSVASKLKRRQTKQAEVNDNLYGSTCFFLHKMSLLQVVTGWDVRLVYRLNNGYRADYFEASSRIQS
jgi:hypothetical protein